LSVALTALVIGSALLLLSAFWTNARRAVVQPLPENLRGRAAGAGQGVRPRRRRLKRVRQLHILSLPELPRHQDGF
jgi:hypothetical protein